jgi:uncharacterized protein DUF6088
VSEKNLLFSDGREDAMSISDKLAQRIRRWKRGAVFTPKDFLDLGSRAAVDQALSRLADKGEIRRLSRGLYHAPRISLKLGPLSPDPDVVAQAVARASGGRLQVTGAQAANALGLSTQVPAKTEYLTSGPTREVKVGKRVVTLRHASPKVLLAPGSKAGTVVQALRYLGPDAATQAADQLAPTLDDADRRVLRRAASNAPGWMRPVLSRLAAG